MLPYETGGAFIRPKLIRKKPPADKPLNQRQRRFVEQYLILGEGRAAAIRAGYSAKSAIELACYLKRLPNVARAIERGRETQARAAHVEASRVLAEYARLAFSDLGRVAQWEKNGLILKPWGEIAEDDRAAIAALSGGKDGARIRLHSKQRALDSLARHLGLFPPRGNAKPAGAPMNYPSHYKSQEDLAQSARAKLRAVIDAYAEEQEREKAQAKQNDGSDA
jgi:phage terminase small subunit